jgi:hypothetical protein
MTTLDQDPGPSTTAGVAPSSLDERRKDRWLVFGPTFVFACMANRSDEARALVLVRLGYASRPWLASNLTARQASTAEIAAVSARRRTPALRVNAKNQRVIHRVTAELVSGDKRKFDL